MTGAAEKVIIDRAAAAAITGAAENVNIDRAAAA